MDWENGLNDEANFIVYIIFIEKKKLKGFSIRKQISLQKYLELVNDLYVEPKSEESFGSIMVPGMKPEQKRIATISKIKGRITKRKTTISGY